MWGGRFRRSGAIEGRRCWRRSVSAEDGWVEGGDVPDSPVEATWPEAEALTDVLQEKVPFYFSFESDL